MHVQSVHYSFLITTMYNTSFILLNNPSHTHANMQLIVEYVSACATQYFGKNVMVSLSDHQPRISTFYQSNGAHQNNTHISNNRDDSRKNISLSLISLQREKKVARAGKKGRCGMLARAAAGEARRTSTSRPRSDLLSAARGPCRCMSRPHLYTARGRLFFFSTRRRHSHLCRLPAFRFRFSPSDKGKLFESGKMVFPLRAKRSN